MAEEKPSSEDSRVEAAALELESEPAPWKLHFAWGVLCLFLLGMIAGLWSRLPKQEPVVRQPSRQENKRPARSAPQPEPVDATLAAAERELRAGRHRKALAIYLHHAKGRVVPAAFAAYYGAALCQEALGRTEEAAKSYRRIAFESADPIQQAAAHLGLARTYLRRRNWRQALAVVTPILLRSASKAYRGHACVADARYLSAFALARLTPSPLIPDFWNSRVLRAPLGDLPFLHTLTWFGGEPQQEVEGDREETWKVRYRDRGLENVIISARFPPTTVDRILVTLSERLQAKRVWSRDVREILREHHARIDVNDEPLHVVLGDLLDPLGIVAVVSGDELRFSTIKDASRIAAAKWMRKRLARRLREAVLEHPKHAYAARAMLEVANEAASRQRFQEALVWYAKVKKIGRHDNLHLSAAFNSALIHRLEDRFEQASEEFYYVIDTAPASALAPAAYLELGRGRLYEGDFEGAVKAFRQGLASSLGSPMRAQLAISLAAAYLLTHRPGKTHETLRRYFAEVRGSPYRSTAAVLDAFARLRLAGPGKHSRNIARDLVAALIGYREDPPLLGPVGILIVGEAYFEAGFPAETARLFASAFPTLSGPIAERMRFTLGTHRLETGELEAGMKDLRELARDGKSLWAERAALRLAEAELESGNANECLQICRTLLRLPPRLPRRLILRQMGLAYEAMGDFRNASLCFAGQVPSESTAK